jgi:hypothetical protein
MKLLPIRPHKRARCLIISGVFIIAFGLTLLTLITNMYLKNDIFLSNGLLKILCLLMSFAVSWRSNLIMGFFLWMRIRFVE